MDSDTDSLNRTFEIIPELGDSLSPVKTPGTPYSVSVLRKSLHQRERFFMSSPTPLKVRNENNQITPLRPSAVLSPPFEKSRDSQSGRTSLDTPVNQISPSKKPKKLCEFPWTELAKKRGFTWETYASASKPSFEVVTKTPSRQGALRMQTPSKVQRFGQPSSLSSKQTPCRFASKVEVRVSQLFALGRRWWFPLTFNLRMCSVPCATSPSSATVVPLQTNRPITSLFRANPFILFLLAVGPSGHQ
uniref:PDZ domain-containing protein n=1 Tax=Mesocestoides corti TaxID=53468 RepID=A0A5K3EUT7_MESCO